MNMLYVDSVMKAFDTKQVLTDVFLTCKPGEILGLLGRNGSGKSTLLKIIFGSLKADQKYIKVDNTQVFKLNDSSKLITYLPHDNFLPGHVKIKTIISAYCNRENAGILNNFSQLQPFLNRKARHLSSGEKRFVEILLIIHSEAKYILIDEPFNGVAPIYIDHIKQLIREQAMNKGFIITDHDYRNILDVASKIILLHDGGTREIEDTEELTHWGYVPAVDGGK